jgi:hypothetical protein
MTGLKLRCVRGIRQARPASADAGGARHRPVRPLPSVPRSPVRPPRAALLLSGLAALLAACGGGEGERAAEGAGSPAPAGRRAATAVPELRPGESPSSAGPSGALAEARKLQLRTALDGFNRALLNYHIVNGRYPASLAEIEADPATAGALGDVRALAADVTYVVERGGYILRLTPAGGGPLTLRGSDPSARPGAPSGPPGA